MARYQVAAINYIASGAERTLLNIDTQLVYHNVRNVYILDSENTALSNIVTEEGDVSYLPTEYIAKEHPLDRRRMQPQPPVEETDVTRLLLEGGYGEGSILDLDDGDKFALKIETRTPTAESSPLPTPASSSGAGYVKGGLVATRLFLDGYGEGSILDLDDGDKFALKFEQTSAYKLSSEPLSEERLSTAIILKEQQKYGYDRERGKNKRILLYLSSNTVEYEEKAQAFADKIYEQNRTFEIETGRGTVNDLADVHNATVINPAYDIRDVSIKSCTRKSELNSNLKMTDGFVDIYAPKLSAYPIGFCQCAGDAYVMTDTVYDAPTMLYSSLNEQRLNYDAPPDFYSMRLSAERLGVCLYKNKSDLGVSSYAQAGEDDIFSPARRLMGIGHNYILQLNQRQYPLEYEDGDVYAEQVTPAKNTYDALYSMKMASVSSISDCREYCGIGESNDSLYLKYYDMLEFRATSSFSDPESGITEIAMKGEDVRKYPFQKVELYLPNSFKYAAAHKSNLFSVRIKNKGIEDLVTDESAQGDAETRRRLFEILHKDIKNACRHIAERAAPVNTQFFDVFFEK